MKSTTFQFWSTPRNDQSSFTLWLWNCRTQAQANQNSLDLTSNIYIGLLLRDKIKGGGHKNKPFQMNMKSFLGNLVRFAKQLSVLCSIKPLSLEILCHWVNLQPVHKQYFSYNKNSSSINVFFFILFSFPAKKLNV